MTKTCVNIFRSAFWIRVLHFLMLFVMIK